MPVIPKPENRGPLFGVRTLVLIGGSMARQLTEWHKRKAAELADKNES